MEVLEPVRGKVRGGRHLQLPKVGVVTIQGPEFREQPGVAAKVCAALAAVGIGTLAVSASFASVSCVVSRDRLGDTVKVLKDAFDLSYDDGTIPRA